MAGETTASTLAGMLKRKYGDKIHRVVPEQYKPFFEFVPFDAKSGKIGEKLYEDVSLALPQGITYAKPGDGVVTYADQISGVHAQAEVDSYEMWAQDHVAHDVIARTQNDSAAFGRAMDEVMRGLNQSIRFRQALTLLYGQDSLGVVSSVSSTTITITSTSFAPGIWAPLKNARISVWSSNGQTLRVSTTISSMDLSAGTITVADATGVQANDLIRFTEAYTYSSGEVWKEPMGIYKMLTTSGTVFGISTSTYNLWGGNTTAISAALTASKLGDACTLSYNKGYMGRQVLWVHPAVFQDLADEVNALRRFNNASDNKNAQFGTGYLDINTQVGVVSVMGHPMIKRSIGFLLAEDTMRRIGCFDVKLGGPNPGDEPVHRLETKSGYQVLAYSHQAPFCTKLGFNTILTAIS